MLNDAVLIYITLFIPVLSTEAYGQKSNDAKGIDLKFGNNATGYKLNNEGNKSVNEADAFNLCSFDENDCGYIPYRSTIIRWEWKPLKQQTIDYEVAPSNLSGYWFADDKYGYTINKLNTARLRSPEYSMPMEQLNCFNFYFYLNHNDQSNDHKQIKEEFLQVFLYFPGSNSTSNWVLTKAINNTTKAHWNYVEDQLNITKKFQLEFKAGLQSSVEAFLAIDDVKLESGICRVTDYSTSKTSNFENSTSGGLISTNSTTTTSPTKDICQNDDDCLNGGTCQLENGRYFCQCKKPFFGDRCKRNKICESMGSTCEAIGATCTYIKWLRKGVCACPQAKTFDRDLKTCQDICTPGFCVYGTCEVEKYLPICNCYAGYEGHRCHKTKSKENSNLKYTIIFSGIIVAGIIAGLLYTIILTCITFRRLKKMDEFFIAAYEK